MRGISTSKNHYLRV